MSMETHREYVGYLDEWDGTERLTDEEVVRCCDCKHYTDAFEDGTGYTEALCWMWDEAHPTYPDAFCAWRERRDDVDA